MKVTFTRRYHFSASHRLDCEALSAQENRDVYGKCNNPHGHGHNYRLEVSVRGPVDRVTSVHHFSNPRPAPQTVIGGAPTMRWP